MAIESGLLEKSFLDFRIPDYLQRILPEETARKFGVAPLTIQDGDLWMATHHPLDVTTLISLERETRHPVRLVQVSFAQVRQYQARLYGQTRARPPRLPAQTLAAVIGLDIDKSEIEENPDFDDWLQLGKITARQWSQITGIDRYLPTKARVRPSPINALTAFLDIEPAERRGLDCFAPLWWANHTLYIGVNQSTKLLHLAEIRDRWPFRTVFIAVPSQQIKTLRAAAAERMFFANPIRDEQVADQLFKHGWIPESELAGALTLNRQTGVPLSEALFRRNSDLDYQWLEEKAALLDSIAIHADDLPDHFNDVLLSLLEIVPFEICQMLSVLPLNFMEGILVVGVDEIHPGVMDILREVTGYRVEARIMYGEVIRDRLAKIQPMLPPQPPCEVGSPQIDAFLTASHLVQPDQLARLERPKGATVRETLTALTASGLLNDEDVAQVAAILFQTPQFPLEDIQPDETLVSSFSQSFLKENRVLPLFEDQGALWVAISDPLDGLSLSHLEETAGQPVWPLIVPRSDLEQLMRQHINYAETDPDDPHVRGCLNYLARHRVITRAAIPEILSDLFEKNQAFDKSIHQYLLEKSTDLYQEFADYRDVDFVSLQPVTETRDMVDPLGNEMAQTLSHDPVESAIARRIDHGTVRQWNALPFREEDGQILVAFADPLFDAALEELTHKFQQPLVPVLTDRDSLDNAIERTLGKTNIGTLLVNAGLISRHQLNDALNLAENTGVRTGQALIHRGYVTEKQLYSFLSKQVDMPLFDLTEMELSREAASLLTPEQAWDWGVLPLAADEQNLFLGVIDPVSRQPIENVRQVTDLHIIPVLITENDFENALDKLFQKDYTAQSVSALLTRAPENSAAWVLTKSQKIWMVIILVLLVGLAVWNLKNFLIGINAAFTIIYMMMVVYKFILVSSSVSADLEVPITDDEIEALKDGELPVYTVLVPVYKEAAVLPSLLQAIENLDYPKIKLDVKVLLEEDDLETIDAFHKTDPPDFIKALIVPTSQPKTKPKACNYGLIHAKGEYLVIFDAEDQPNPDQLKRVVAAFNKSPENVICMQAKLNYFNRQQNALTQLFSSEYSMWFDLFLPGLDAHNVPIPLGGTSNHFKTYALLEAGAWDPHNMTEDADLGIRLYKLGYRTKIVDSTTYEEANSDVNNWVRQRSRWVKGHIQTWLVHMRHPFKLIRDIGLRAFFSFQMVIGGNIFTLIVNPLYWFLTAAWFLFRLEFLSEIFPGPIYFMGAFSLFFGNFAFTYMNTAGAIGRKYYDMVKVTLLSPLYWVLMSIAGWRGFLQLITKPHYWEKTIHGLADEEEAEDL
jgi:cellulose synthase/poly-beta-1,6-N-acetylglucosamine synthase-like glycosyltransferase